MDDATMTGNEYDDEIDDDGRRRGAAADRCMLSLIDQNNASHPQRKKISTPPKKKNEKVASFLSRLAGFQSRERIFLSRFCLSTNQGDMIRPAVPYYLFPYRRARGKDPRAREKISSSTSTQISMMNQKII